MSTIIKSAADFKKSLSHVATDNLFDSEEFTMTGKVLIELDAEYDATKARYRIEMPDNKTVTILSKTEFEKSDDIKLIVLSFNRDVENYKGKQGLNFKKGNSFIIAEAI